jgi:dTMP kinase
MDRLAKGRGTFLLPILPKCPGRSYLSYSAVNPSGGTSDGEWIKPVTEPISGRSSSRRITMPQKPDVTGGYCMLIAFEGPDEVGKTSLASALVERLRYQGFAAEYVALPGHVVGTLGHHVYELHHNPADFGVHELDAVSTQLLHVASHIDQLHRAVVPALARGETVVLDRYWWSAPVYAAAFGVPPHIVEALAALERAVWRDVTADIVFLVRRALPLTRAIALDTFLHLRQLYDDFATQDRQDVVAIENERDFASALTTVERAVSDVLRPSARDVRFAEPSGES